MDKITIDFLREIGQRLKEVIPPLRFSATVDRPLKKGASGDRTFEVDQRAENLIIEMLKKRGLSATVVSEEIGELEINGGGDCLVIDPIDGSKNAVTGIPLFCSSIAVAEGDRVSGLYLSYIINHISGDEFWAERQRGAFLNGRPISTQRSSEIRVIVYETQVPGRDIKRLLPLLSLANRTRCLGSTALDLAFVSSGAASLYVNPAPTRSFDYAAGLLLLKEAGGVFSDLEGNSYEEVKLSMKSTPSMLCSANPEVHERALEALNQ